MLQSVSSYAARTLRVKFNTKQGGLVTEDDFIPQQSPFEGFDA